MRTAQIGPLITEPLAQNYLVRANCKLGGRIDFGVGITDEETKQRVEFWLDWTRNDGYEVKPDQYIEDVWTARKPGADHNDYVFILVRDERLAS